MEGGQPSWTSQGKIDYIYGRQEGNTYAYIHSRKESYHGLYQEIELNESHNGGTLSASFRMKIDNSNVEIEFWDPYLFKNFRSQAGFQFDCNIFGKISLKTVALCEKHQENYLKIKLEYENKPTDYVGCVSTCTGKRFLVNDFLLVIY